MTQQTSPFLEGKFGWNLGESNWNFGMDENLLKFSYMFDRNIDGIVSSLPAVVNGTAYFNTTDNRIYFAVGGSYTSTPTPKWFIVTLRSTGVPYQFDGTALSTSISNISTKDSLADTTDIAKGFSEVGTTQFGLGKPGDANPPEKGFWTDVGAGANIWRLRDRVLIADACDYNGTFNPGVNRSWIGNSYNGFMTYFDSRSQLEVAANRGSIAGAFGSRSSDNVLTGELNTIGVGSFVDNNNTSADPKSSWAFYGHAVHAGTGNHFTCGMELDICNLKSTVAVSPYSMGAPGTTAGIWVGVGGETAQSGVADNPASAAITVVTTATHDALLGTGSLFAKGLVFQASAISGTNGVTGSGIAIEMAKGHRVNWLTPTNDVAGYIRSDNTNSANTTSIIFGSAGLVFRGLQGDLVTEQNLLLIAANPSAVNFFQMTPAAAGTGVAIAAVGADANIDFSIQTKGTGVLRFGTFTSNAETPVNGYITIKDAAGVVRKLATIA